MTLYEINSAILALVDEDGEIADFEEFDKLMLAKEEKIENVALYYKNLMAEAAAIKNEEDALKKRRIAAENKAESLKNYLNHALRGENFKSARVAVSYRKSTQTVFDDEFVKWAEENADDLLRYAEPEPKKSEIKERLKNGEAIPHAALRTVSNITVR